MGFAPQPGEIYARTIVVAFDGKTVRFALEMTVPGEDQAVGMPEVRAEGDRRGARRLRSKRRAVSAPRSPSVQPQIFLAARSTARHFGQHPIHHRVAAHTEQPLGRPQANALQSMRQRAPPLCRFHPAMIPVL